VVDVYCIVGIHHLQASQEASFHPEASQHMPQHFTQHRVERLFEVHKATIEWLLFCLALFNQSLQYEKLVNNAVIFAKPNLTLGT
jgi:hypothetical protein